MFLYESNSYDKIKSLKRSGLLSLVDLLSGWAESSCTEDGNAGSPTQSASVMRQGQTKEFQDPDLVTQQEPFETVQLPQMSTYSVIQQFAICPYDFNDALLHQLAALTIMQQLL